MIPILLAALAIADPTPATERKADVNLLNADVDTTLSAINRMLGGKPLSRIGGRPMFYLQTGLIPFSSVRSEVLAVMTEAGFEVRETDQATVIEVPENCSATQAPTPTTHGRTRVALVACGHAPELERLEDATPVADQLTDAGVAYEMGETPGGLTVFVIR